MTSFVAYILYGLFALGGVGLYLAMPRATKSGSVQGKTGAVIGVCAIVGLLVLLSTQHVAPNAGNAFFYFFSGIAILAAGRVVTHPMPIYSAVYFGLVILCVTALLITLQAEFLAVALIIIYAGAILVTYAFVIMLAQQSGAPQATDLKSREPMLAILVSFVLMGAIAGRIGDLPPTKPLPQSDVVLSEATEIPIASDANTENTKSSGNTIEVGRRMFGPFVVVVELAGLLLLVAMIGAIAIARKRVPVEETNPPPPIGQIGKEVPPF